MIIESGDGTLSRNIRYLRKKYRLSRRAVSLLVEIPVYELRGMEWGTLPSRVNAYTLHRLCQVFAVSVEDLFHTNLATEAEQ